MRQLAITSRLTNRETDSFNYYLKIIGNINLLSTEEELVLTEKTVLGDREAIDELVLKNLRFVVSVAKQYVTNNSRLEDLVNEGNIGLIKAAELFDPKRGNKFISFAVFRIRKTILEYLGNYSKMVRLPANKLNGLSKLEKKISKLEQTLGRSVDINEIVTECSEGMGNENIVLLHTLTNYTTSSLDRTATNDDSGSPISDLISDDSLNNTADHLVNKSDVKSEIGRMLNTLKPRDKNIMISLYGLDGKIPLTLSEIGERIGISREMVRQIKIKSLESLKTKSSLKEIFWWVNRKEVRLSNVLKNNKIIFGINETEILDIFDDWVDKQTIIIIKNKRGELI